VELGQAGMKCSVDHCDPKFIYFIRKKKKYLCSGRALSLFILIRKVIKLFVVFMRHYTATTHKVFSNILLTRLTPYVGNGSWVIYNEFIRRM